MPVFCIKGISSRLCYEMWLCLLDSQSNAALGWKFNPWQFLMGALCYIFFRGCLPFKLFCGNLTLNGDA